MAKKRIDMRKVRKLLRLHYEQGVDSVRQLSQLAVSAKPQQANIFKPTNEVG